MTKQKASTSSRTWAVMAIVIVVAFGMIVWMTGNKQNPSTMPQESVLDRTDVQTSIPSIKEFSGFLSQAKSGDVPRTFQFEFLNFEESSASLLLGADDEMDQITAALEKHPLATVSIEGFADQTGDLTRKKDLAFRRALVVEEQLISRGINPDRIDTVGNASGNKRVSLVLTSIE